MQESFIKTQSEVKDWFAGRRFEALSLDIETDGLGIDCILKGISFCDGIRACYVDFNDNPEMAFIIDYLKYCLPDAVGIVVGHNLSFDLRVLKQYGINYTGKIYDTMVAAHLLNENKPCGLKALAIRVLKVPEKEVIDFKEAITDGYSSQKFLKYAINDSIWTWQLYEITKPLLTKQGLDKLFYKIEMPFQFVLIDMFINGIKIDVEKLEEFDDILTAERTKAEIYCMESIGLKMIEEKGLFGAVEIKSPVNLNSSQQLAEIIEGQLKIKLPRTKPSERFPEGQPSTSAKVIKPLKDKHKFIEYLLKYRKCEKLLNTFIHPLYDKIDKDGRLRTSFNDCVARTGRLSSSGPNLQNIPKELGDDDIVNIREVFIADKDRVFVRADYDLQEVRQLANVSGDKNLIHILNSNQDVHLASANGCLNLGLTEEQLVKTHPEYKHLKEVVYKKERHIGKNGINFPVIYGSTKYGVSKNNNVSEEEAQSWIDGFFRLYPDVAKALKRCKQELWNNHYVTTYFGRRRRFGKIDDHAIRQAFNVWIQGMCADLLRVVMNRILECYQQHPEWEAKVVMTVHDDIISSCKRTYAQDVLKAKKEIMENAVDLPVKFLVDIGVCSSYGE